MKRLLPLTLLVACFVACGSASPPVAQVGDAPKEVKESRPQPIEKDTEKEKEESVEDAAMAFFQAVVAGDRKAALARTITFDEMNAMTKKVFDRASYESEITDQVERLCQELANKNVKVKSARVVRRRTATVAENPEKVKVDVELAAMGITFEHEGQTREAPTFSFIKVGASWKFTTRNA
jgi:hypothetical protein